MNDSVFLILVVISAISFLIYRKMRRDNLKVFIDSLGADVAPRPPDVSSFELSRLVSIQEEKCFELDQGLFLGLARFVTGVPGYEVERAFVFSHRISSPESICCFRSDVNKYVGVGYGKPITREVQGMDGWRSSSGSNENITRPIIEIMSEVRNRSASGEVGPSGLLVLLPMNVDALKSLIDFVKS